MRQKKNMTGKVLALLLAALSPVFLLTACSNRKTQQTKDWEAELRENQYVQPRDPNTAAVCHNGILYFVQTCYENVTVTEYEGGFYSSQADCRCKLLYYADLTTGESGVLCGRPECAHADASCSAYIQESQDTKLMVYQDRLYRVEYSFSMGGKARLVSTALDGSDLIVEKQLDALFASASMGQVYLYRDRIYVCGCANKVSNGVPHNSIVVYSEPLEGDESPQVIFEENPDCPGWSVAGRIRNGNLFFVVSFDPYSAQDETTEEPSFQPTRIYACHLSDGSLEQLYHDVLENMAPIDALFAEDDRLILRSPGELVCFSLSDRTVSRVYSPETEHATFLANGVIGAIGEESNWSFYRENGETIFSAPLQCEPFGDKRPFYDEIGVCDGIVCRFAGMGYPNPYQCFLVTFDLKDQSFHVIWENECTGPATEKKD